MNIEIAKLITPDGTELVSRHRHHFCCHVDSVTGNHYFIDGGSDYVRRSDNGDEKMLYLSLDKDGFNVIRENFARYNSLNKEYVLLKDMSDEWLQNTIDYLIDRKADISLYLQEKLYRNEID